MESIAFSEEEMTFDCCTKPFSIITLSLELVRYPNFYYLYVFLPFLSQLALFLLIFHIHPSHGDRLSYGVALLLNMTMYMIFISDKLPEKSDNQPIVGTLFVAFFFTLSVGLILSAVTMMFSRRETPVPKAANKLKRFLNRCSMRLSSLCPSRNTGTVVDASDKSYQSYAMTRKKQNPPNLQVNSSEPVTDGAPDANSNNRMISASSSEGLVTSDIKIEFQGWEDYMRFVDKCLFYVFLLLLIIIPFIIAASLDQSNRG